jgi:predicted membrane protein
MEQNFSMDKKTLRSFGLTSGLIVILLFEFLVPWLRGSGWPAWPWVLSSLLILAGLIVPDALGPVFKIWMKFGQIMNRVNTTIILTTVFFLVFTPVALIMKIIGRDVMHRKFDKNTESYRITSEDQKIEKMERPF